MRQSEHQGGGDVPCIVMNARAALRALATILLVVTLAFAWPGGARAADFDRICGSASLAALPSSGELLRAAGDAENALGTRSPMPLRAEALLSAPAPGSGGTLDAAALAAYCSAAGEAARKSPTGSAWQAQTYLQSAIRYAARAGEDEIYARSAYRLALSSVGGAAASGTRGRGRRGSSDPTNAAAEAQAVSTDECSYLERSDLLEQPAPTIAASSLSCAMTRARKAGNLKLAVLAGLRLTHFLLAIGESAPGNRSALRHEAARTALASIAVAQSRAEDAAMLELLGRLVESAIDAGAADPAMGSAVETIRTRAAGNPATLAFAAALEGRLALSRGDRAAAAAALRQAVFYEAQRAQPLRMADWLLLLAEAEPAREGELVIAAYRALDSIRPLLPVLDPLTEESNFSLRMRPVFERAVAFQLGADPVEDMARIASAQQIVEQYREAELQSVLGVNCVAAREPIRPAELRRDEVLLYPILLPDRLELIYATGAGGRKTYRRLPPNKALNRAAVAQLVGEFVDSASYGDNDKWKAPARTLYDALIGPIEGQLGQDTMLVIVPDGPLRALPFAALTSPDGRYLVQKTRVSVAPSLGYSQPGFDPDKHQLAVVAASLQKEVVLPAGTFPRLAGTADEARLAVGTDAAERRRSRLIENFKRSDLAEALSAGKVDVLHLATHATFNGSSERSFILALDGPIPMSDLRTLIGRSRDRGDQLDLLVLSACETAVGDDQASMGLAGAAVQAGARSALASLWQVNDIGTAQLMKGFYGSYRAGKGKAEALRTAQLSMIERGGEFANPNIWAAFELLGGWR